ncbi:hypothetical protein [Cellulomonas sp. P24]|uniref:hypothetical protein n=1 Tax=Cellulomonas sp. P24 TaxID=2885206 RepID=UPI00216B1FB1|nr:hypothetical protein [Cellulomonas sp. P24]MCR6493725.1 hypothetical protein [Cellulomonas sp. P24]
MVDGYRAELVAALRHSLAAAGTPGDLDEKAVVLSSLTISAMLLARIDRHEADAVLGTARHHITSWATDDR